MPTSNGQVGRFDIRQDAVHTIHVVDDAIETAKIPDMAITFPDKIDDPIWSTVVESGVAFNETLTTTPTVWASVSIDIPSWVDQISVLVIAKLQMSLGAVTAYNGAIQAGIDGSAEGNFTEFTVQSSSTNSGIDAGSFQLVGVAGSTVTVDALAYVNTGTNSSNQVTVSAMAVGAR